MRVFIDARDLIDMFNHARPITIGELADLFKLRGHTLVLPFSVISELVPDDNNEIVVLRRFVKIEEDIPHTFFQQHQLLDAELKRAVRDFLEGRAFTVYDPYIASFAEMWSSGADPILDMDVNRTIGMRKFSAQIRLTLQDRWLFHWRNDEAKRAVKALQEEQSAVVGDPAKVAFAGAVGRWLNRAGVQLTQQREAAFSKSLRQNPRIAPGWRLFEETFDQLARDKGYRPTVNDVWDFANIMSLPYLDAATLDKNKADLVRKATARLRVFDKTLDYPNRVFPDIRNLLSHLAA